MRRARAFRFGATVRRRCLPARLAHRHRRAVRHRRGRQDDLVRAGRRQVDETTHNVLLLAPQLPKERRRRRPRQAGARGWRRRAAGGARDVLVPQFPETPGVCRRLRRRLADRGQLRRRLPGRRLLRAASWRARPGQGRAEMLDSLYGKAASTSRPGLRHTRPASHSSAWRSNRMTTRTPLAPSIALLKKLGLSEKNVLPLPVSPPRLGKVDVYRIQADHHRLPVEGPPDGPLTWFLTACSKARPLTRRRRPAQSFWRQRPIPAPPTRCRRSADDWPRSSRRSVPFSTATRKARPEKENKERRRFGLLPGTNDAARVGTYWKRVGQEPHRRRRHRVVGRLRFGGP